MFGRRVDYDIKVELAKCCNGLATVYLAEYTPNGQHVAIKKYALDKATKEEMVLMVHDEILNMRQFNHPHLHSFYTAFVYGSELHMISPLMSFGSCKDTIRNCFNTGFPEIFVALIMRDVLSGLEYLHRRGYIHRSIRASHILLTQTKAVLAGFRSATCVLTHGKRVPKLHMLAAFSESSLNWLAPEVLEQNLIGYTEKSDIYSIGITCCELANGLEPFADAQPTFMFTEKIRGNVPTLLDSSTCHLINDDDMLEMRDEQSSQIAAEAKNIYNQRFFSVTFHQFTGLCLDKRPNKRWSALQLISHGFLKQCRHTSILSQLQRFGIEVSDYSQLRGKDLVPLEVSKSLKVLKLSLSDENLTIFNGMQDLNVKSDEWEWNF